MFVATAANGAFGLLFWVAASRSRPSDLIGRVSVAVSLGQLVALAAGVGIGAFLSVRLHVVSRRQWRGMILISSVSAGLAAISIGVACVGILGIQGAAIAVVLIAGPLMAVGMVIDGALVAMGRSWLIAIRHGFGGALRLIILLASQLSLEMTWIIATLVAILLAIPAVLRSPGSTTSSASTRTIASEIRAALHHHLVSLLATGPQLFAPWFAFRFAGASEAAGFYLTLQFAAIVSALSASITAVALPVASREPVSRAAVLEEARRLSIVVTVAASVLVWLLAPTVLRLLGSGLAVDYRVLGILLAAELVTALVRIAVTAERVHGRLWRATKVVGAGAIVSLVAMGASGGDQVGLALAIFTGSVVAALSSIGGNRG